MERKIENEKKGLKPNTLKGVPKLWFWLFPSVKSIIVNKHVISNLKLKRLWPKKVPIK